MHYSRLVPGGERVLPPRGRDTVDGTPHHHHDQPCRAGWSSTLPIVAQAIGSARGALLAVGGNLKDRVIVRRFVDLAGGPDAPIVVIPTAGEDATHEESWLFPSSEKESL